MLDSISLEKKKIIIVVGIVLIIGLVLLYQNYISPMYKELNDSEKNYLLSKEELSRFSQTRYNGQINNFNAQDPKMIREIENIDNLLPDEVNQPLINVEIRGVLDKYHLDGKETIKLTDPIIESNYQVLSINAEVNGKKEDIMGFLLSLELKSKDFNHYTSIDSCDLRKLEKGKFKAILIMKIFYQQKGQAYTEVNISNMDDKVYKSKNSLNFVAILQKLKVPTNTINSQIDNVSNVITNSSIVNITPKPTTKPANKPITKLTNKPINKSVAKPTTK